MLEAVKNFICFIAGLRNEEKINASVFDLLKILEKDCENNFHKDKNFDKLDWNYNAKCMELFKNFFPNQQETSNPVNNSQTKLITTTHSSFKKFTKKAKLELKTIQEEDSMKILKKIRVFEKIRNFHENLFIFRNSFAEFSLKNSSNEVTEKKVFEF